MLNKYVTVPADAKVLERKVEERLKNLKRLSNNTLIILK